MKCTWHCCSNEFVPNGRKTKFCSKKCKNKYFVNQRRKKLKLMAVEYRGGQCTKCGYKKCVNALEFHHVDDETKDFGVSSMGYTRSWDSLKIELDKCDLVCSNCHREIHTE